MAASRDALQLGWMSVALGLTELTLSGPLCRTLGFADRARPWVRLLGARELTNGLGLLSQGNPKPWLAARVVGDVVDLALVGAATTSKKGSVARFIATAAVVGITIMDVLATARARSGHIASASSGELGEASGELRRETMGARDPRTVSAP